MKIKDIHTSKRNSKNAPLCSTMCPPGFSDLATALCSILEFWKRLCVLKNKRKKYACAIRYVLSPICKIGLKWDTRRFNVVIIVANFKKYSPIPVFLKFWQNKKGQTFVGCS